MRLRYLTAIALAVLIQPTCSDSGTTPTSPEGSQRSVATIDVSPPVDTITALHDSTQFTAVARDAGGNTVLGTTFTWSSSNPAIAHANSTGFAIASAVGTATIMASAASVSGQAQVVVDQRVATVTVDPTSLALLAQDTARVTATPEDANGNTVQSTIVTWSTSDPGVATVDAGLVTAVGAGSANITAEAEGHEDVASVSVLVLEFVSVTAGGDHSCGLTADGGVYCWGRGNFGNSPTPVRIAGLQTYTAVEAGQEHTCGIIDTGDAYCWGRNHDGKLGHDLSESVVPALVPGGHTWASISAGFDHTCGVTTAGAAYCWGNNFAGTLGDGSAVSHSPDPLLVSGGHTWESVSAGSFQTCGLTTGGDAYCWGFNDVGQLGDGTQTDRNTPTLVTDGITWQSVSAGGKFACGVSTSNVGYCWGSGDQLGDLSSSPRSTPGPVSGGLSLASVISGNQHSCAIATGGELYCWGRNFGALGNGDTADQNTPVLVVGGGHYTSVSPSQSGSSVHTCGMGTDGLAYCWGLGDDGQLGTGGTVDVTTPMRVLGQ